MSKFQRPGVQNQKKAPSLLLCIALTIALLILISSVVQLARKQAGVRSSIRQLKAEHSALLEKEQDLEAVINYLQTPEGKEQALRDKYRLVKPGEDLVIITDPESQSDAAATKKDSFFKRFIEVIERVLHL